MRERSTTTRTGSPFVCTSAPCDRNLGVPMNPFASTSKLLFPAALDDFRASRSLIRTELKDTFNRLHSIAEDSDFIEREVHRAYPDFPMVANQRAGGWYVRPSKEVAAHAYFKSTDGHIQVHNFNLRRANLALVPLIAKNQGIVLVDSTRRGKRFPDALSKTIPIWCAVLNRARVRLLPPSLDNSTVDAAGWARDGALWTSPSAVGRSEHSQIEVKIEEWADSLLASSYDLSSLKALSKPLRPIFVSPSSTLTTRPASSFSEFYAVVCASASKLATEEDGMERARGFTYVQGSGDDHEAWSKGLTPPVFWENEDEILSASRDSIDEVIASILSSPLSLSSLRLAPTATEVRKTGVLVFFGIDEPPELSPAIFHLVINAAKGSVPPAASEEEETSDRLLHLYARSGKAGYPGFFSSPLENAVVVTCAALQRGEQVQVSVAPCEAQSDANDLGIAVVVMLLVLNFDDDADLRIGSAERTQSITKQLIRARLNWFLEAFPDLNPSRNVLIRVNEWLISGRRKEQ